ncbi:ABC transporter ATP-binding protein [Demequina zhanjiangensis]|uniref:ABC transporter ATP-binding protein n=1 Tax=Demequina zhanjiangensis TaxID=3051659 RepID=A0ABT8G369_9MICO|nr:ABC transporter ATP-binding protein [Demequina sp. SYSU T00b26]MDN4473134.1 ABC transporter ATP-binding protein [Demequina sp. SYSU T00b26]
MSEPTTMRQTLKRGFALSPEFRKGFGITLTLAGVAGLGKTAVPFVTQQVTDRGLLAPDGVDVSIAFTFAAIGAALLIGATFVERIVRIRMVVQAEEGLATLRIKAFDTVHDLSVLTQNADRRGSYVSRVTGDVETMRDLMQWTGAAMMIAAFESMIMLVVMLVFAWQLALVVIVAYIPTVVMVKVMQPRIMAAYGRVRARAGDLLAATGEQLVGISTIRSYGVHRHMRDDLARTNRDIVKGDTRAGWLGTSLFSTNAAAQSIATGLALVVGTRLALDGAVSVGTVVAFAFLVYSFAGPIGWIIEMLAEMQRALVGWRRVIGLVDTPVVVADPGADGTPIPRGRGEVSVEGVRLQYPTGPEVLKGIDLEVPAGRRIALVGETGSGKTSFVRLLARFIDPTGGGVRIGGVDLRDVPMDDLRRSVAIVPQEGFLFDGTIRSNLAYALDESTSAEDLERQALAVFESLGLDGWLAAQPHGLDTPVGPRGELLSAGERQLVAIARAYLRDPDVLILDEATSAVDPATEVRISRALESLMRGRTAIVIAHRLSTAERADLVAVMDAGELVEVGSHSDLVELGGTYARMHEAWVAQTR